MPCEHFETDWIRHTLHNSPPVIEWQMSMPASEMLTQIRWTEESLLLGMNRGVQRMARQLGDNPYVCLSGGVDSQAACLLLLRNNVRCTAAIMRMEKGLNDHDYDYAVEFCQRWSIPFVVHLVEAEKFMWTELSDYVLKYQVPSPQFALHFKFFEEVLRDHRPTALICGGNAPNRRDDEWEFSSSRAQTAWVNFANVNNTSMVGNFLAWSMDIALPLMLFRNKEKTYRRKVDAYLKAGLPVAWQAEKFTGFEKLKQVIAEKQGGDGWAFEKLFRHPYQRMFPDAQPVFNIPPTLVARLNELNDYFNTEART